MTGGKKGAQKLSFLQPRKTMNTRDRRGHTTNLSINTVSITTYQTNPRRTQSDYLLIHSEGYSGNFD
jgi:hypothetical protein